MLMVNQLTGFGVSGDGGNDQYTKSLIHFDGADAATSTSDVALGRTADKTWTFSGNAQLDTSIVKFGSAALLLDATGDHITTSDHADFTLGSSNFVAEIRFTRAGGDGGRRLMFGQANSSGAAGSIFMELNASNQLQGGYFKASAGANAVLITGSTTITATGWHLGAIIRSANNLYLALDGVIEAGPTAINGGSGSIDDSAAAWSIGRLGEFDGLYWNGSLDEFRLSVGTDRGWVTNFTPPSQAYF